MDNHKKLFLEALRDDYSSWIYKTALELTGRPEDAQIITGRVLLIVDSLVRSNQFQTPSICANRDPVEEALKNIIRNEIARKAY